jgi:hypothetical protein
LFSINLSQLNLRGYVCTPPSISLHHKANLLLTLELRTTHKNTYKTWTYDWSLSLLCCALVTILQSRILAPSWATLCLIKIKDKGCQLKKKSNEYMVRDMFTRSTSQLHMKSIIFQTLPLLESITHCFQQLSSLS